MEIRPTAEEFSAAPPSLPDFSSGVWAGIKMEAELESGVAGVHPYLSLPGSMALHMQPREDPAEGPSRGPIPRNGPSKRWAPLGHHP